MSHVKTVELQPGEDRAVTLVVYSGKAFVGLANEWEQDTSSVVQVAAVAFSSFLALVWCFVWLCLVWLLSFG
eukprot:532291-Rhodomonas_salina.3